MVTPIQIDDETEFAIARAVNSNKRSGRRSPLAPPVGADKVQR
jgi:hypothetical protein